MVGCFGIVALCSEKNRETKQLMLEDKDLVRDSEKPVEEVGQELVTGLTEIQELGNLPPMTEGKENEQTESAKTWKLHYVDAWGEWHDAVIDPTVSTHGYEWNCLTRNGQDIIYLDQTYHSRKGVDVSHHQGEINWEKVKAAGYDFAILRIAYRGYGESGNLMEDKKFFEYYEGARAAGLDVGVYLFSQAVNEQEAFEEAQFVLKLLDGKELQLPVTYDPETIRDDVARTDAVSGEQFTKNAILFCDEIEKAGYEPMIYSNMVWEDEFFDMKLLEKYTFWYADYEPVPQTPYQFAYWQYSEKGSVDGIEGAVDLDIQFIE